MKKVAVITTSGHVDNLAIKGQLDIELVEFEQLPNMPLVVIYDSGEQLIAYKASHVEDIRIGR